MKRVLHTALLSIVLVGPAGAQGPLGPRPGPAYALFRPGPTPAPVRPAALQGKSAGDHALEGMLIGGAVGALFLGFGMSEFCGDPDAGHHDCTLPVLGAGGVGFLLGGSLGALVGVFIPKHPDDPDEERPNPYR